MTLIITEVSHYGIAMAADSAETLDVELSNGERFVRVSAGVKKLQPIPYLSAAISGWGRGEIPDGAGTSKPTDVFMADFIARHADASTIDSFASELAAELESCLSGDQEPLGFHLAGIVDWRGGPTPTLYHVRNCDGKYGHLQIHEFIAGHDVEPQAFDPDRPRHLRNGDFGLFAKFIDALKFKIPFQYGGIQIPHPSLLGRALFWGSWIKFISDLYAASGLLRTIGGPVSVLTIDYAGTITQLTLG